MLLIVAFPCSIRIKAIAEGNFRLKWAAIKALCHACCVVGSLYMQTYCALENLNNFEDVERDLEFEEKVFSVGCHLFFEENHKKVDPK